MKKHKRVTAFLLSLLMVLSSFVVPGSTMKVEAAEPSADDMYVNTEWILSNDVTSRYSAIDTQRNGGAFTTGKSTIGDIDVTATFQRTKSMADGISYLSKNAGTHAAYDVQSNMLYGNPDPAVIPTLGLNTQPGSSIGDYGSYDKMNINGVPKEEGILTFRFDKPVTNPIIDISGLGGYTEAYGIYYKYGDGPFIIARGSFNSTDLELITPNVSMEVGASNSNFTIDGNTIKVKERNAHTKAVKTFDYNDHYMYDDNDNYVGYLRGPYLEPAGSGSVLLKGTFQEVSFKLYHVATPYSAFSTWNYGTSEIYSWKSNWGPQYGDGINGLNLLNTEKFTLADKIIFGQQQNWDMFRASLRLPKTSAISGKAWIDVNRDGINNDTGAKPPKTGVTVQLLDGYGNPARDYNGNIVPRIPVNPDGTYRFDNLAPGDYKVKFEDSYKAGFTYKDAQGSN